MSCSCTLRFLWFIVEWQQSIRRLIGLPVQGCPWQVSVRQVKQGWHLVQKNSTTLRHTHPVGSCLSPAQREAYGADRPFFPQEVEEQLHVVARLETTDCSYVYEALRYCVWRPGGDRLPSCPYPVQTTWCWPFLRRFAEVKCLPITWTQDQIRARLSRYRRLQGTPSIAPRTPSV